MPADPAKLPPVKVSSPETRGFWEIPVLFEDDHLLALEKPAGLLTSPDRHDPHQPNLMGLLHEGIRKGSPWAVGRKLAYLATTYRLDLETSGVLLLAKTKQDLVSMANQFGTPKPSRKYVALMRGEPEPEEFEIDAKLAPHPVRPHLMVVEPKLGKQARTLFQVLERFRGYTLVRCVPQTARPHQIRVHARHAGYPLMGDPAYGGKLLLLSTLKTSYRLKKDREERPLLSRVALHSEEVTFSHPSTSQEVTIRSAWPKDFEVALKYLRRYAKAGGPTSW